MDHHKIPNQKTQITRVLLEVFAFIILVYPLAHIYLFLSGDKDPQIRGFFCDDESIKYPIKEETVTTMACFAIFSSIVAITFMICEVLIFIVFEPNEQVLKNSSRLRLFIQELYRLVGYFVVGAIFTLLITEIGKFTIGRLRPNFLAVCNISLSETLCKDGDYDKFVADYTCKGDVKEVRDARKSFLSGHSSFSFYCAVFLALYLQSRLSRDSLKGLKTSLRWPRVLLKGVKILRPFLQFGFIALATYVAMTRVSDYKHHPGDVATGAFVGTIIAILTLYAIINMNSKPRVFFRLPNLELSAVTNQNLYSTTLP